VAVFGWRRFHILSTRTRAVIDTGAMSAAATSAARALVEEISSRLAPLEREMNLAWWAASTSVTETNERRRVAAEITMSEALADREQ
jgi:hypothetical protein